MEKSKLPVLLFNCSTNVQGGGVKNSAIFIRYARKDTRIQWKFAVSSQVCDVLKLWDIDTEEMLYLGSSPARDKASREKVVEYASEMDAEMVFTMAGPAYVDFDIPHVMGISNGFVTHASLGDMAFGRSFVDFTRVLLTSLYKALKARKASFWIFQTEEARSGFCRRLYTDRSRTAVVTNAIDLDFSEYFAERKIEITEGKNILRCLVPASSYRHKAVHFVPRIAQACKLLEPNLEIRFILTLNREDALWNEIQREAKHLGVDKNVSTIGSYNYANAKTVFSDADFVFVPSMLETFSASYLEAFASKKALIAADKSFAREICGNGAIFVDPRRTTQAAEVILSVAKGGAEQKKQILNGLDILKSYGSQKHRYEKIVEVLMGSLGALC